MKGKRTRSLAPVFRMEGHTYLLVSLISFAGTVILTRLFLEITGYPQLGGGELHIAHVLWGGVILFIAALLPLIFANRWAYSASALLSGIGVGLFIDEVGKLITQSNDYFYPPAAPIVYAFFLLTVLLYLRLKKREKDDARHRLYQVLSDLTGILDGDLDTDERLRIERNLREVLKQKDDNDLADLSNALLDHLQRTNLQIVPRKAGLIERINQSIKHLERKHLNRTRFKFLIIAALLIAGLLAWLELIVVLEAYFASGSALEYVMQTGLLRGEVRSFQGAFWFIVHLTLQGFVGFFSFAASLFLLIKKDHLGVTFGVACMVLSLTAVNLLAFFVDQFSTAAVAIYQLFVLLALSNYRNKYIPPNDWGENNPDLK